MAIENYPVIKKVNNPYEFAPVVPANIQKVDMSKPNVPLVQTAPINYVAPKKAVAKQAPAPVSAPVVQPKTDKSGVIQAMIQKNPRLAEAYNAGKVNENDIFNAAIKKYPKIKSAVLAGEVELNTVDNKGVVPGPTIVEKGLGVLAGASKGALDYLNKANIAVKKVTSLGQYDPSTDPMQQAYQAGSDLLYKPAQANDTGSFGAGEVGGKTLASMALIPGLGPIKGAGVAKNIIAGALEGAATTQANSYIDTGKTASLKDTLYGAAAGGVSMGVLRKLQKGGSLKQTEDLIIPKQTGAEEVLRSEAGLRKKSFFGGEYKPMANNQEKAAALELQTILRPNKGVQENANIVNKAIERESTSMRKLVENTPMVDKSKEALDMNLQTFRKKVLDKFIGPTTRKSDIAAENRAYKKLLGVVNSGGKDTQIKRAVDIYNKEVSAISPNLTKSNIKLADKLKSAVVIGPDKIVNDVKAIVDKIDVPRSVKSDATILNKWNNIKNEYLDILSSNKNKGHAGILDSRQELDRIINRDYPNLYTDDANAPLREMVSKLRNTSNDILNKATNGATKESLRKQTLYYSVRDKLNTKIEKTGSTNLSRWAKRNPKLNKFIDYVSRGAGYSALGAAGAYAGIKANSKGGGE